MCFLTCSQFTEASGKYSIHFSRPSLFLSSAFFLPPEVLPEHSSPGKLANPRDRVTQFYYLRLLPPSRGAFFFFENFLFIVFMLGSDLLPRVPPVLSPSEISTFTHSRSSSLAEFFHFPRGSCVFLMSVRTLFQAFLRCSSDFFSFIRRTDFPLSLLLCSSGYSFPLAFLPMSAGKRSPLAAVFVKRFGPSSRLDSSAGPPFSFLPTNYQELLRVRVFPDRVDFYPPVGFFGSS